MKRYVHYFKYDIKRTLFMLGWTGLDWLKMNEWVKSSQRRIHAWINYWTKNKKFFSLFYLFVWFSLDFSWQIKKFEKMETVEERRKAAREIYDNFIMKELLSHTHVRYSHILNFHCSNGISISWMFFTQFYLCNSGFLLFLNLNRISQKKP